MQDDSASSGLSSLSQLCSRVCLRNLSVVLRQTRALQLPERAAYNVTHTSLASEAMGEEVWKLIYLHLLFPRPEDDDPPCRCFIARFKRWCDHASMCLRSLPPALSLSPLDLRYYAAILHGHRACYRCLDGTIRVAGDDADRSVGKTQKLERMSQLAQYLITRNELQEWILGALDAAPHGEASARVRDAGGPGGITPWSAVASFAERASRHPPASEGHERTDRAAAEKSLAMHQICATKFALLTTLYLLPGNTISPDGSFFDSLQERLQSVLEGKVADHIVHLRMRRLHAGPTVIRSIARHSLPSLRHLDLRDCAVDDDQCEALFQAIQDTPLHSLNLQWNSVDKRGCLAICDAIGHRLTHRAAPFRLIDLRKNPCGDADTRAQCKRTAKSMTGLNLLLF